MAIIEDDPRPASSLPSDEPEIVEAEITTEMIFAANDMEREPGFKGLMREFKPSIVTGGASATPLLVLASLNAFDELDAAAFGLLLPEIRDYFGVSTAAILTVSSIGGLLTILFAIPVGFFADRVNRTRLVGIGATMWGAFSMLTGFASNLFILGVARLGSGLGKTLAPAHESLLADYYPPNRRVSVFSFHRFGNQIGVFVAPTMAGLLATWFFWQMPFLLFGIPSLIAAGWAFFKLREPFRGNQERRVLGMSDEAAETAEEPPTWSESWRIAKGVRTLRRIWMTLPLTIGVGGGLAPLIGQYYVDEFGLTAGTRGLIASGGSIVTMFGMLAGLALGSRLLRSNVARLPIYGAILMVMGAFGTILVAIAPAWWMAIAFGYVITFVGPIFGPAVATLMTIVIPPRVRGFSGSVGAVFAAPGLLLIPVVGAIGDAYGIRFAIFALTPINLIAAAIIASAAPSVTADIRAATAAAAASTAVTRSKAAGREKLLVCKDVDVHYGQIQILFNVDFEVEKGEIIALLGTNGAGKSTLLNAISGGVDPSNGAIVFEGKDITYLPASENVDHGIVMVPGGKGVFPSLTVAENLRLATWPIRDDPKQCEAAIEEVLEFFPRLRERWNEPSGALSGGEQQMLTLGQAFISNPKLLMIDELSLGLAPVIVAQLLEIVRAIHAKGTTIILVEQSVNVALTVANRAVFMEKGEVRFSGPTEDLLRLPDVLRSVFLAGSGQGASARRRQRALYRPEDFEIVLDVKGITKSFGGVHALNGVDLTLRQGEILGIIGPNGAGKTTLFDAISGFITPDEGTVTLVGQDVTELGVEARAKLGLQRSFQQATLFPALTVEENLMVALDRHLAVRNAGAAALHLPQVSKAEFRLKKRAERLIRLLNLEPFRDKFVRELSTGSRRIVDMACVLGTDPEVLLLDEPSSGVAQRETEELGPLINRIRAEADCAILLIEHDMALITSVSDELIAMELGTNLTRGRPADVLENPRVVESYLGTSEEVINRSGNKP